MTDEELAQITAAIHDGWFDLNRLAYDSNRSELRVTIYPGRRSGRLFTTWHAPAEEQLPEPIGELVVRQLIDITIKDEAGVGWFDVGGLAFDPGSKRLRLRSNVSLEISMRVQDLDVELVRP